MSETIGIHNNAFAHLESISCILSRVLVTSRRGLDW
jgi:hypothetical protein